MFIRNKNSYLITTKIEFGTMLGCDTDADAYITLKEMPTSLVMRLRQRTSEDEMMEFFHEILPEIIVDHNLYEDETTKMTNEAIADLVYDKVELTGKVFGDYSQAVFRNAK